VTGNNSSKGQPGVLFGLVFFVVGLVAFYFIAGNMIVGYIASANWVEVPAKILNVRLVSDSGDGDDTHTVLSTYTYNFDGVSYQNDRVSLSSGRDSFGQYWQELERTLLADKSGNEAFAIVNPDNPTDAVLDRTLRWQSVLFGLIFLFIFSGVGGFILWSSLFTRRKKINDVQLLNDHEKLIHSNQKTENLTLAFIGGFFFVVGLALTVFFLPKALRAGEYGALSMLLFLIVGGALLYHCLLIYRAYKRFGPTPLLLDPPQPGVGGQLGGRLNLYSPGIGYKTDTHAQLQARLTCSRKQRSKNNTSYSVLWQEDVPAYIKQTALGVEISFLFDIPDSCIPSEDLSHSSSIEWNVSIEGEFSSGDLGKFERDWQVVVRDRAALASQAASQAASIPQSFMQNNEQLSNQRAKASALKQVPVFVDGQYINVHRKSGRRVGAKILALLLGVVLLGVGIITVMQGW